MSKCVSFPCIPGDSVFMLEHGTPRKYKVKYFKVFNSALDWIMTIEDVRTFRHEEIVSLQIGREVFLSMEDAIEMLRKQRREAKV